MEPRVANELIYKRMNRTAELEIAAEAYGHVGELSLKLLDCKNIRKGLRRVIVTTLAGVYYRDA